MLISECYANLRIANTMNTLIRNLLISIYSQISIIYLT